MIFGKKQAESEQSEQAKAEKEAMERRLATHLLYTGRLFSEAPSLDVVCVLSMRGFSEN